MDHILRLTKPGLDDKIWSFDLIIANEIFGLEFILQWVKTFGDVRWDECILCV